MVVTIACERNSQLEQLGIFDFPAVPSVDEVIRIASLDNYPFIVKQREWAIDVDGNLSCSLVVK